MRIEMVGLIGGAFAASLWGSIACSSSNGVVPSQTDSGAGADDAGQGDAGDGGGQSAPGMYAFVTQIDEGGGGSRTYVDVTPSLDVTTLLHLGRPFPGRVSATAIDGKLFVGSGEAPAVTRFALQDATTWTAEGELSFAAHGASSIYLGTDMTVSSQKAYLLPANTVDRIVWNPSALTIGTKVPADPRVKIAPVHFSLGKGPALAEGTKRMFQPVSWVEYGSTEYKYTPYSQIAVYDGDTDQTRAVLDVNLPNLERSSKDAAGNMYFSSGSYSVMAWKSIEGNVPRNGIVRIRAGEETVDSSFAFRFEDVTEGRDAAAFHAVGDGKGFIAVFHHERATGDSTYAYTTSKSWRLWKVDLNAKTAAPLPGVDYFNGYFTSVDIDSRHFVLVPSTNFDSTTVYEVLPDFSTQKRFETRGFLYGAFRVK